MSSCRTANLLSFILLFCVVLPVYAAAVPTGAASGPGPVSLQLTPQLQALLTEEMIAISAASTQILNAVVAGDHGTIAKQAQTIHDSFILEKKLTKQDREAFEKALPPEFVNLDAEFHAKAAHLADVARRRDVGLEHFYFARLIDACQACHSHFATKRFPGLAGADANKLSHGITDYELFH